MGSFANSLFKIMLGWLQTAVSSVWSAFTSENGSSLFNWLGQHWILTAAVLCCAGLAADLCVYLLRWKPYKVWKSFWTRKRVSVEESHDGDGAPRTPVYGQYRAERKEDSRFSVQKIRTNDDIHQDPDLSKWENDSEEYEQKQEDLYEEPATVTNAGYVVPADSPYRRPVKAESVETNLETLQDTEPAPAFSDPKEDMKPAVPRRRRKLNVSELFSNPEEELQQCDAPQHVIDSRKAYRNPVYPRGWEKDEGGRE